MLFRIILLPAQDQYGCSRLPQSNFDIALLVILVRRQKEEEWDSSKWSTFVGE